MGKQAVRRASTSRAPSMLPYFLNTSLGFSRMLTTRMASCGRQGTSECSEE